MIKLPSWALSPLMLEAGVMGIKLARLNNFPELTQDDLELLSKLVSDRVEKSYNYDEVNSKKKLNELIKSNEFRNIVYQELGTIYEL